MTPLLAVWLLSIGGALLFFTGGSLWGRLWFARQEGNALSTVVGELEATRAHMRDQEQSRRELRGTKNKLVTELSRSHAELERLRTELHSSIPPGGVNPSGAPAAKGGIFDRAKPLDASRNDLSEANGGGDAAVAQLRRELAMKAQEVVQKSLSLTQKTHDIERLETELRNGTAERRSLEARVQELAAHEAADTRSATLKQELAFAREALTARDAELETLREASARLRWMEEELTRSKQEVANLTELTRGLRAEAYAAQPTPRAEYEPPATLVSTRGGALQSLVDVETRTGRARSAVIADELGLVVAASGFVSEYGEALAALGAYLADIGAKTRDVLPLLEVRQVVVRDNRDMTLTVRPLAAEDPGLLLSLVTLSMGKDSELQPTNPPPT